MPITGASVLISLSIVTGSPIVIMPQFDPEVFCQNIEKYKVTAALIVPPVCLAIVHHPGTRRSQKVDVFLTIFFSFVPLATNKYNLKTLRVLMSGVCASLVDLLPWSVVPVMTAFQVLPRSGPHSSKPSIRS